MDSLGFGSLYSLYTPSCDTALSEKQQNILLADAAGREIAGDRCRAAQIYGELKNNAEAQAHSKRMAEDTHSSPTQQLLHLAQVAEKHGSLNTAFRAYNALLLHREDGETLQEAELQLKDLKFKDYFSVER
jgi:hypothetical protein